MTAAVDPTAVVAQLRHELAAMHDPMDVTGTDREREAYEARRSLLRQRISQIRASLSTLAEVEPLVADAQAWREHLTAWRQTLADELLALPPNPRTDKDRGRQHNLMLSIRCIDHGTGVITHTGYGLSTLRLGALMLDAGYVAAPPVANQLFGELPWFGSMPEVEHRLKHLAARRVEANARLADGLLDDDARMARDAARRARAAHLNTMSDADRASARASATS